MAGNIILPPFLRQDLNLYPAEPDIDGTPAWILHDPLANRHFRLDEHFVEILAFVGLENAEAITEQADKELGRKVSSEEVEKILHFLRINNLVQVDQVQLDWFHRQSSLISNPGWFSRLAKSYLFIRIPLWHPDKFLDKTLPLVSWMGSKPFFYFLILSALSGLFFVSREFDVFLATFMDFFTLSGLTIYLTILAFSKIMHELGHAYVAKYFGCRIPVIGVALLVGWPVLYTDTSDAWKLGDRRKRMLIGIAGVGVEIAVACISLLLWSVVADGPLRSALFVLTTTTWLLSLVINFNPLMRFDGYYLLSDYLCIPNLEYRSFDMTKWWLREKLFALRTEPPEHVRGIMIFYAFAVWLYRFFLFLGIALLVYHFFFKVLGIVMFVVEIAYFIVRPILREVAIWWKMRKEICWNHGTKRAVVFCTILLLFLILPWYGNVNSPAILDSGYSTLYTPSAGLLIQLDVSQGEQVQAGQLLGELQAPQLEYELKQAQRHYEELNWRRASMGFDPQMLQQSLVVTAELLTQNQKLRGLLNKRDQLRVIAPIDGLIVDLKPDMKTGSWLANGEVLFAIRNQGSSNLKAYVREQEINRIQSGMRARFYAEDPAWGSWEAEVTNIDQVGVRELDNLYLASLFGGEIAVREGEQQTLLTQESLYVVVFSVIGKRENPTQVLRGQVVIEADSKSIVSIVYRYIVALLQRESGF
ncbi:MAG: putative peptide zinc metalloprotease protein [Pseudohongiellaceae bacterium]|jgi:putative peptide zinc metalloprotease protein